MNLASNEIVQIESSKAFRISSVFCRNFSIVSICASKNPRGAAVSLKVFRWHQCHVRLVKKSYEINMSHIRTFLRANYTFCAYKRFLIDKNLRLTCFISKLQGQSQCKRNFNTSSLWRNKESRKSGNIADILVKESSLETLVDPTGAGIDMTGKLDRS